jgi:DNA-binding HxlR family transcriptional regulator
VSGYGQFCPVAKAMEILDERWTMLIVRELLNGSSRFNELRRGVPRMSPTLLSRRLQQLERLGLVDRVSDGGVISYRPTERCLELRGIVEAIGVWGLRWIGELGAEDLDPHLLFWDMRRTIPVERWPRGRTVLEVAFDDVEPDLRHWWLVVAGDDVDVCDADPGYPVNVTLRTGLRTMTRIWRGDLPWDRALRTEQARIEGPREITGRVPDWLGLSRLASLAGPERRYAEAG